MVIESKAMPDNVNKIKIKAAKLDMVFPVVMCLAILFFY